jgi:hypothetical protein
MNSSKSVNNLNPFLRSHERASSVELSGIVGCTVFFFIVVLLNTFLHFRSFDPGHSALTPMDSHLIRRELSRRTDKH